MQLLLEVLRTVEFLADAPAEVVADFAALGRLRTLPRGHVFWRDREEDHGIVIPVTGELALVKSDSGGRELWYACYGTGDCAGISCVLDAEPAKPDLRVVREGQFFLLPRAAFLRFLGGSPPARAGVLRLIGSRIERSLEERDRIVFLAVNARLARFLLERSCARGSDGARILTRLRHAEIAARLGSVREVVARTFRSFAERGLVRHTRRGLFVVDWAGLCAEAGCRLGDAPDCACDFAAASIRTRRFHLPVLEQGPRAVAGERRVCTEYNTDPAVCVARGCALAVAARHLVLHDGPRPPPTTRHGFVPTSSVRARRPALETVDVSSPEESDDVRDRSPREMRTIARRIATYRRRAARIESQFETVDRIPASASVFDAASSANP